MATFRRSVLEGNVDCHNSFVAMRAADYVMSIPNHIGDGKQMIEIGSRGWLMAVALF